MIYLTLAELIHVAERTLGGEVAVRDYGLLESALARPQATVLGTNAYDTVDDKTSASGMRPTPADREIPVDESEMVILDCREPEKLSSVAVRDLATVALADRRLLDPSRRRCGVRVRIVHGEQDAVGPYGQHCIDQRLVGEVPAGGDVDVVSEIP